MINCVNWCLKDILLAIKTHKQTTASSKCTNYGKMDAFILSFPIPLIRPLLIEWTETSVTVKLLSPLYCAYIEFSSVILFCQSWCFGHDDLVIKLRLLSFTSDILNNKHINP